MRVRFLPLVLASASLLVFTGCSSKPENSPVIRTRFAQIDTLQDTIDQQSKEIAFLNEQVRRLSEENSELKTLVPGIDESTISNLATIEERLSKLETMKADGVISSVIASSSGAATASSAPPRSTSNAASSRTTSDKTVALDARDLAISNNKVAVTQEKTASKPAVQQKTVSTPNSFKVMTNRSSTSTVKQPTAVKKPAAPVKRGGYHVIQSGETVESIAKKNNISVEALLKANRLPKGIRLGRGQRLFIPAK